MNHKFSRPMCSDIYNVCSWNRWSENDLHIIILVGSINTTYRMILVFDSVLMH